MQETLNVLNTIVLMGVFLFLQHRIIANISWKLLHRTNNLPNSTQSLKHFSLSSWMSSKCVSVFPCLYSEFQERPSDSTVFQKKKSFYLWAQFVSSKVNCPEIT